MKTHWGSFALVVSVVLLSGCSQVSESSSPTPTMSEVVVDEKFIELVVYDSGTANAKGGDWSEFRFPKIFADNNGVAADKIITDLNASVIDRVAAAQAEVQGKGEAVAGWEYELEIKVTDIYSDPNLLIVNFSGYQYLGNASGEEYAWTKAYEVKDQSEIILVDEFTDSGWSALGGLVARELEANYPDAIFYTGKKLQNEISKIDFAAWEISSLGLEIWLPKYAVTAGYAGTPSVRVGWSELRDYLTSDSLLTGAFATQINSDCDEAFPGIDLETCE